MTLLARDEADIVDAQLAFHLAAGVDLVIATDNASEDGTTEILERYERDGVLHLIREDRDDIQQDEWVTRMARLAAADFAADWVINSDADEFWWPRGGSLKDVLENVPERYGVVRGCWRHFLPRPENGESFAERMTVRLTRPAFPGDKSTIYHAHQKVAHRAATDVRIEMGNHNAFAPGLETLRGWHPLEVLHFSFRSLEQLRRKCRGGWWNPRRQQQPALHQELMHDAYREGRLDEYLASYTVTDEQLEQGLADGTLAVDTRVRDALRRIGDRQALTFPRPGANEDALYAGEASVLVGIDGIVRAEERVDAMESRLSALEREPLARLRRLARR
jgi:hypothetical protein